MYNKFFGSGTETKPAKDFLTDNRAQRLLISILDGSFEKQVQTNGTTSKTGIWNKAYVGFATVANSMGYTNKRQTVDAIKDVSADSIKSHINVLNELGIHQGLIPEAHKAMFNQDMSILTAILKIEQAGFASVIGSNQDANNVYTDKLIEIIRVLIREKGMVPSEEDYALMRGFGGAFNEFLPQIQEPEVLPEPMSMAESERKTSDEELEQAVDKIIAQVKTIEVEKLSESEEEQVQPVMPRNYFRLWDKIDTALKNQDSATLTLGIRNLTEEFEFSIYAKALISVANDFKTAQSPIIKEKLLGLRDLIQDKQEQIRLADEQARSNTLK